MRKMMVIWILFNTVNYTTDRLTQEWLEYRLDIFEKYTLKSLKNQSNQDFRVYLCCEESTMPMIRAYLDKKPPLPNNIQFDTIVHNEMDIKKDIMQYDFLYHIRLDSDNLYHQDFIQKLYDYVPKEETQVIISQNGYVYDTRDDSLAPYFQKSPPFYAFIYKVQDYIDGFRYRTPLGHSRIINLWKYEFMEGYNYIVSLHGKNVLNRRDKLNEKLLIEGDQKEKVLGEFGIQDRLIY